MAPIKKAETMDDIARQASQGSLAAIIQLLNDKLADSGVRTRAIIGDDGILQLLCEGATVEQLEQLPLVERIRQILETISPRNIRRVNINSRIVREQQLLWLEEISQDPEAQLLWSEEIVLAKPNILRRLSTSRQNRQKTSLQPQSFAPSTPRFMREKRLFWRGIMVGGVSLLLVLFLVNFAINELLHPKVSEQKPAPIPNASNPSTPAQKITPTLPPSSEAFAEAVRMAEKAGVIGKNATSASQWLELAAQWQRASDLMAAVPSTDSRYKIAQNRVQLYRQNSLDAQQKAKIMQSPSQ